MKKKKLETIFIKEGVELSTDENLNLYWNGEKVITEEKVTLQRSVNVAIICASISTIALAIFGLLELLGYGAK